MPGNLHRALLSVSTMAKAARLFSFHNFTHLKVRFMPLHAHLEARVYKLTTPARPFAEPEALSGLKSRNPRRFSNQRRPLKTGFTPRFRLPGWVPRLAGQAVIAVLNGPPMIARLPGAFYRFAPATLWRARLARYASPFSFKISLALEASMVLVGSTIFFSTVSPWTIFSPCRIPSAPGVG
jgi:hypothetical protein